jgi:CDP-glucose 4,6-dehydratase
MEDTSLWGEAFNFSNEIQVTVLDLVQAIRAQMHADELEPIILNETRAEIPHQYLSAEKARRVLGWSPAFDLERGLRETIAWYREFFQSRRARLEP